MMLRAQVRCRLSTGERLSLGRGDFIGRAEQAALCLDDPRISEAHAMVSLRGSSLMLLALRGRFRVNGEVCTECTLREGLSVELCEGVWLHCEEVVLPGALPGIVVPGLPRMLLTQTTTIFVEPIARVQPGYDPDGDVVFWALGEQWSVSIEGSPPQTVKVGDRFEVRGRELEIVPVPITDASRPRTRQSLREPMRIEAARHSCRLFTQGEPDPLLISGIPGKILAALARSPHPQSWRDITSYVWPGDQSLDSSLRRRFDVGLSRLRERLVPLELSNDLIEMDGCGMIQLQLDAADSIEVIDA